LGRSVTYIGRCYLVQTVTGELLAVDCEIGVGDGVGLVSARSRRELVAGAWLPLDGRLEPIDCLWYRRRRPTSDDWYHDLRGAVVDMDSGAVYAPRALVCDIPGDFICGG